MRDNTIYSYTKTGSPENAARIVPDAPRRGGGGEWIVRAWIAST